MEKMTETNSIESHKKDESLLNLKDVSSLNVDSLILNCSENNVKTNSTISLNDKISQSPTDYYYSSIPLSNNFVIDGMVNLVSSQFFDITMALKYLYTSNDFEVLECLGIKLKVIKIILFLNLIRNLMLIWFYIICFN